ncbi:MAG: FtsX-like permease family protein [Gemmatimonadetes bacterium]|nr:FtsX-like permease family protein [Gemmatimonadota bacterium]
MFKSYLHIAARHLTRHRLYALTNVGGLAVGLAGCMLMAIWVLGQLETDRFHEHGERIYRVVTEGEKGARLTTPAVLGTSLQRETTEVEAVVRMLNVDNPVPLVSHGEKRFYEDAFLFADPEVLKVFTLPLVAGDAATALAQPFTVLLSESAARKLFGDADPMGQVIRFKDHLDLKVTGILRDLPEQSHLRIEFLASFATVERWLGPTAVSDWRRSMYRTYLLLRPGVEKDALRPQLDQLRQEHFGADDRGHWELQALQRIHLHSREDLGIAGGGDIREVIILATVACLVLLVACLNYANLGTALAAQRVREIGLRLSMGAGRSQLARQFLIESAVVTSLAFAIAVVLADSLAPYVTRFGGMEIALAYSDPQVLALMASIFLLAVVLSGGYPAFCLARIAPVRALEGSGAVGSRRGRLGMVTAQFVVSVGLLCATAIAQQQLAFIENAELGIETEQVLVVPIRSQPMRSDPQAVKARLGQLPEISSVSAAALFPAGPVGRSSIQPHSAEADPVSVDLLWVDAGATETLGMTLAAGEGFTETMEPRNGYFVLSQAAVQALGWESAEAAIGRTLAIGQAGGTGVSPEGTVVGVVEDFHSGSLRRGIQPVVMQLWPWHNYLLIRFRAHSLQHVVQQAEAVMVELDPVHPFEYSLLDDRFAALYRKDERLGTLFAGFGGLSLLVACVGMFGLASFAAQRRRMEFGVRKVLGASGVEIGRLLAGELTRLVLVASLLACPIAYFGMAGWMEQFSERAEVGAGPFVAAVAAALVAAWVSVAYHAVRTSRIDPVEALRYE